MSVLVEEPVTRDYWHSDHYRNQVGNSLIGPLWDVLADHPGGVTVPQIRDALTNDHRIRAMQSWLISFGAEQRLRAGSQFEGRYRAMDPKAYWTEDDAVWSWDVERRYRYALTERVHDQVRTMVKNGEAIVLGASNDLVSNSEVLYHVIGSHRPGGRHGNRLPLYGPGDVPLITDFNPVCPCGKVHHTTYKRRWVRHEGLGPDPYVLRQRWRAEVEDALAKGRLTNARELLERGADLMRGLA